MRCRGLAVSFSVAVIGLLTVSAGAQPAAAVFATLETDVDPQQLTPGTSFTVVVGLDGVDEIRGYTLGVAWSGDRLALVGAAELACKQTSPSVCEREPFTVDPLAEVSEDHATRAAVLVPPPLTLFLDGRTTLPAPDPQRGLFALTFEALEEGPAEVTGGILDETADGIVGLDDLLPLDPATTTLPLEIVPEPGAAAGIAAAALALAVSGRARRSRRAPTRSPWSRRT